MAFSYNHTTLVGRLTKDAAIHELKNVVKSSFTIAVDRYYRKEDGAVDTDFIPVIAWGRLAEVASLYLKKGNPVLVEGRIQVRQYEKEGSPRWMTEIVAENFQMLGGNYSKKESNFNSKNSLNAIELEDTEKKKGK